MFGYSIGAIGTGSLPDNTPIALSASQSQADIHNGTNITANVDMLNNDFLFPTPNYNIRLQNGGVDNPQYAAYAEDINPLYPVPTTLGGPSATGDAILTSIQPVLLSCDDIDFEATKGISNTIFANFSYGWEKDTRSSFLGIGASAEFGKAPSCCNTNSNCGQYDDCGKNCINSAVSQWTVWIKGGVAFN